MGMPVLEFSNWLHQATTFYAVAIPLFIYMNNFAGPRILEPAFCRDYLMAHFEKIADSSKSTVQAVGGGASVAAPVATPAKVPIVPKNLFARCGVMRGSRVLGLASMMAAPAFARMAYRNTKW